MIISESVLIIIISYYDPPECLQLAGLISNKTLSHAKITKQVSGQW